MEKAKELYWRIREFVDGPLQGMFKRINDDEEDEVMAELVTNAAYLVIDMADSLDRIADALESIDSKH